MLYVDQSDIPQSRLPQLHSVVKDRVQGVTAGGDEHQWRAGTGVDSAAYAFLIEVCR
ncbi:hypothetical protein VCR4J2_20133 [Vibrio coralliirubri]|nr:hypothetical protein VCR4J2_20133 [Vibrio coralliirubri]